MMKPHHLLFFPLFVLSTIYNAFSQWNIVYSTDTVLTSLNFISEDTGFVGGLGLLNFTNNGGESLVKSNGFTTNNQIWDIDFSNSNLLFLSSFESQAIWKSTNGGLNWANISDVFVGGPIYDIDVVNDTVCYGGGDGGYIYYTKDGFDVLNIENVSGGDIFSISFPNLDTGYVAGGVNAFLKTENGAETWININFSPTFNAVLLDFCSPSIGFVTDGYDLYKTHNYGANWSFITIPESLSRIVAIEYINNQVCYIAGDDELGNSSILKTLDGGESWINTSFDPSLSPPTKIVCLNDSLCYALSSNGIGSEFFLLKTTNGGGNATLINNTNSQIQSFTINPNPAKNYINISSLSSEKILGLHTFNLLGEIIDLHFNSQNEADTHLLPAGIYYTNILTKVGYFNLKWVKL